MQNATLFIVMLVCQLAFSQSLTCEEMTLIDNRLLDQNKPTGNLPYPFFPDAKITYLNIEAGQYCEITREKATALISTYGFKEIKSRFQRKQFSIFITMRRKAYEFRFDATYKNAFSMEYKKTIPFIKEPHQTVEGISNDFIYNNKWITVNGIHYSSAMVISSEEKTSRVGMGFIKGFDWIIDTQNKKVYIRKNSIGIDTQNNYTITYKAEIRNNRLVVVSRNSRFTKYNVGDVIQAVDSIEVTPGNMLEMAALLSSTTDWQLLNLEVIPIKGQ